MAFTTDDFSKIWASTSPLTPYEFSDSNYTQGWNFVGSTPPARQMWDKIQKLNDEKSQYLYNQLSIVGTIVDESTSSAVSIPQNSATTVVSINLDKGNWVITGHAYFNSGNVTANKVYSIGIGLTANTFGYGDDGSMTMHASFSGNLVLQTTRILQIGSDNTTVYMCSLCNAATSISIGKIRAIRIS